MQVFGRAGFFQWCQARLSKGFHAVLSLLLVLGAQLAISSGIYLGVSVTPARAQFAACDSTMWLVQFGTLYRVSTTTNPFTFTPIGSAAANNYNGADFNPADNFIYAMNFAGGKTNHLLRVRPNGTIVELGAVSGLPAGGNYRSGAFSPAGNILYVIGANTPSTLYRINVSTMTATSVGLNASVDIADLAWVGGLLYSVEQNGQLVSINPTSGAVTKIGTPGPAGYIGAMFGAPNGLFGSNNGGGFYQFDLTTGARTLLSGSPAANSNDGMHCPAAKLAFGAELAVTKTDGSASYTPGAKSVYTIEVTNAGPFGAQGVSVSDPLPGGIPAGAVSWTCSATAGATCTASGTGAISDSVNVPVDGKVTYKLTIDVPFDFTGPLTNTVTITPPDTVVGDDPANNIATDTNVSVPRLTLQKQVINDNGGTRTHNDFVLKATGPTSISGIHASAAVTAAPVQAGTYTLSETGPAGYAATDYACSVDGGSLVSGNTITLENEQQAVCTVVNDDQQANLTLSKTVINNYGGTAAEEDFVLIATGPTSISGTSGSADVTAVAVDAGTYTLSEDNLPGYVASAYSCVVNGKPAVSGNSLTLEPGEIAACTIVNDNQPARLTLNKTVINDNGGTAHASDFTLTATGPVTVSGKTGTTGVTNVAVPAGTYELTETSLPGYAGGTYSCSVDGGAPIAGNSLTLALGQEAVCSVVNNDIAAQLTLIKTVTNDNGGTATPANFTLTATGPITVSGVTGASAITDAAVPAGTYTLRETNLLGYIGSDYSCVVNGAAPVVSNTLALANGDVAVCTIANDDQPATLTLVKTVINDDGGNSVPTDFTLSATSATASIFGTVGSPEVTAVAVPAGIYDLSETVIPGYATDGFSCVINGSPAVTGDQVTLVGGDVAVCTITNNDIPPAVTISKRLVGESMTQDEVPEPGEILTYEIRLTNTGGLASNYSVTDMLDGNVDFVSADEGGSLVGSDIVWNGLVVPTSDGVTHGELLLTVTVQVKNPIPVGQTTVTNMVKKTGDANPPCPSDQCVQIPAPPNIEIKKELTDESMGNDGIPMPNEILTYKITLTNTGGAAINYSVTDVLDSNVTFDDADHNGLHTGNEVVWDGLTVPGQVGTLPGTLALMVSVKVNDPLTPGAIVTNLAKETGAPDPHCPSDQCVRIPDPARITIEKFLEPQGDGSQPAIAKPGEELTYNIRLTNYGGATNSFSVTDKLDPNTTLISAENADILGAGVIEWTNLVVPASSGGVPGVLDLIVKVEVADPLPPGTTEVTNIAFETGQPEPDCPSQQCVMTQTPPVITIDKQLIGESGSLLNVAEPGETLTYQITLTNSGGPADDFNLTDKLDPNVEFVSASGGGIAAMGTVNWTGLAIPGQNGATPGTRVLTVRTKVMSPLPDGVTSVSNIAFMTGDPEPDCPSPQCVELPTPPNVSIRKVLTGENGSLPGVAEPGETLTYQITLTNTGGPASNYGVTDRLDPNVTFASADPAGTVAGNNVEWTGLNIPQQMGSTPGELVLTLTTTVSDPIPAGVTQISNIAYQSGQQEPSCPSDQCASLPTPPAISIEKHLSSESGSRAGIAEPGETLTYTITLTNLGGPAANFAVTDILDPNVTFANASDGGTLVGQNVEWTDLSVPGQVGAVPGTRTLVVRTKVKDSLPKGVSKISNLAMKTGDPVPSCPSQACVETSTPAEVTVFKELIDESLTPDEIAEPGERLTYAITLKNDGGTDFSNYRLTENVPEGATLVAVDGANGFVADVAGPGSLDLVVPIVQANDTATVKVEFTIADPLPAGIGKIINTVSGGDVPPDCITCTVLVSTPARVEVQKALIQESIATDGMAQPGEVLTYELTLTNEGGSDFVNFRLTENVPVGATLTSVVGASGFSAPVVGPDTLDLTIANVPALSSVRVTVAFTIDQTLPAGVQNITNTVSGGDIDPGCTSCSVSTPTAPSVTLVKTLSNESITSDQTAQPGEVLTYTLTLTNGGGSDFTNFRFTENVPAGVTMTAITGANGFSVPIAGPAGVNLVVPVVPANDTAIVTVDFTVDDVLGNGIYGIDNVVSGGDIDPGCTTCTIAVPTAAKVELTKELTGESITENQIAEAGEVLTYTLTLANSGGVDFTDFDLTENIPAGATLTGVTGASGFTAPVSGPGTLDLRVATVPLAGSATVVVEFTVDDPLPAGLSDIANTVSGGDIDPACTTCTVSTPLGRPALSIVKTGIYEDSDGSGGPTPGDKLSYSFVITNTGNLTLDSVSPVDAGPTFNGQKAASILSAVTPSPVTLVPGQSQTFTATYPLAQSDIDNAAGIMDGVSNTARAHGYRGGAVVPSNLVESTGSVALIALPSIAPSDITVTKQAGLRFIRIGEKAPYTIEVTNNASARVSGLTVTDIAPAGFRYVEGSATIDDVVVSPIINGRNITFADLTVPGASKLVIRLQLMALSSAGPGKHVNTAIATDKDGARISPEASATVEILVEPIFDCGEIIGKVFDDKNGNGYQDDGEPGLPGVRLATVKGVLVTTDAKGRFHIACADLPDQRIGSNFILKLDTRTLPTGYRLTTENPRVVRLTAGKMSKLNFGASIGRVVRLELKDEAFLPGKTALQPVWDEGLDQLVELLGTEPSILRIRYVEASPNGLADTRMRALEDEITKRWRAAGHRAALDVETRVEAGQ